MATSRDGLSATGFSSAARFRSRACAWSTRSTAQSPATVCRAISTLANTARQPGKPCERHDGVLLHIHGVQLALLARNSDDHEFQVRRAGILERVHIIE